MSERPRTCLRNDSSLGRINKRHKLLVYDSGVSNYEVSDKYRSVEQMNRAERTSYEVSFTLRSRR